MSPKLRRELGLLPLVAVFFFNVSGGPYGIEPVVPAFGPGLALLLLVLTPLLWSLPVTLVMSELASAMPHEGGYVTWTQRAFGPFWAFQVGWWSWIDSFVDVAVYPALVVEYARFWFPSMGVAERAILALVFVVVLTGLNLVGVRPVGRAAVMLAIAALAPIAALVVVSWAAARAVPWSPWSDDAGTLGAQLGVGLAVMMWNYSGWDMPSTCLGETCAPERAFRRASWLALPVITAAYLFPVAAGLAAGVVDWRAWDSGTLPTIAAAVGGSWLGHALALGAVLGTAGQFLSLLLTNSRLPYVLAEGGLMPARLGALHPRYGTPWAAVIVSSVFYSALALVSFKDLVVLSIWLYSLTLVVELAAFVWLRLAEPRLDRPWRVPGGTAGAIAVSIPPALFAVVAMATAGGLNTVVGIGAALSGPLAYAVLARRALSRGSRR